MKCAYLIGGPQTSELRFCHPPMLIYGDLASEALCEARVIQFTISPMLHPDALFLPGSQIYSVFASIPYSTRRLARNQGRNARLGRSRS
jgi:hypothetical protein